MFLKDTLHKSHKHLLVFQAYFGIQVHKVSKVKRIIEVQFMVTHSSKLFFFICGILGQ